MHPIAHTTPQAAASPMLAAMTIREAARLALLDRLHRPGE
jgi:hypothetical protein